MTKLNKSLRSRVGICRSGVGFDIPHDLDPDFIEGYVSQFEVAERVDIFCMCEAIIVSVEKSVQSYAEHRSIKLLYRYLWQNEVFSTLKIHLTSQGLHTSPDYVRFGQLMLLG